MAGNSPMGNSRRTFLQRSTALGWDDSRPGSDRDERSRIAPLPDFFLKELTLVDF